MRYNIKNKTGQLILSAPLILLSFIFTGCPEPPEFDNTPKIAFESIEFDTRTDPKNPNITEDILSLTIYFEDGDGDLGLSSEELAPPYNQYNLPLNNEGQIIFIGSQEGLPPYNPLDYFVVAEDDTIIVNSTLVTADTFLIERNPRFYNMFIKTFYKPASEFVEYKWEEAPYYQSFNGRFPQLNTEDYDRPINGTLTYDLTSLGFRAVFRNYPMFVQAQIWDRAGNKSNVINSDTIQIVQQ
ncbi:hypothetical protein JKA74_02630 [Marivirga sp. S37H4]|uniref:Uncharacterized protein n=1 Tax=Marivirga aurantiaca TaxID=2802615 RepID=A0A935C5P0_9BACT|nr:hypothetical protein [Marivirga aurantiaca]MBK6263920.1 hypothetical protein [Marivirga aurantiaca]